VLGIWEGRIGRYAPDPSTPSACADRVIPTERRNLLHPNYLQELVISSAAKNLFLEVTRNLLPPWIAFSFSEAEIQLQ
jgi:hypothetical protein